MSSIGLENKCQHFQWRDVQDELPTFILRYPYSFRDRIGDDGDDHCVEEKILYHLSVIEDGIRRGYAHREDSNSNSQAHKPIRGAIFEK